MTEYSNGPHETEMRFILRYVFRRWYVVLGSMALFVFVAFALSEASYETRYRATSLVIISPMSYTISPTTQTVPYFNPPPIPAASLVIIATSDIVLQMTLESLREEDEASATALILDTFRKASNAQLSARSNDLIELSFDAEHPDEAARIVNIWANEFVSHVNHQYNQVDNSWLYRLEQQREQIIAEIVALNTELQDEALSPSEALGRSLELDARRDLYSAIVTAHGLTETGLDRYFNLQVASRAVVPEQPIDRGMVIIIAVSSFTGAVIAFALLLVMAFLATPLQVRAS